MRYYLNLSDGFKPFNNPVSTEIVMSKNSVWTGGEINIQFEQQISAYNLDGADVVITARLNDGNDVMRLLMATGYLRSCHVASISLFVPYFPYARQDRVCNVGEPFSLKVMADLINAQGYKRVWIFDPHSNVTPALVNNAVAIGSEKFMKRAIRQIEPWSNTNIVLVAPDEGARKRVENLARILSRDAYMSPHHAVFASKIRNLETGEIVETVINDSFDFDGKIAFITDDICDGGRSFFPLAKKIKTLGASKVVLVVSHGIFSYGFLGNYKAQGIDEVVTTDSIRHENCADDGAFTIPMNEVINV